MSTISPSSRPLYSSTQLDRYFSHINFKHPKISQEDAKGPAGLSYLTSLHKHQMAAIPFENLSLHYSKNPTISTDPHVLYHKIVEKGHGGYCMENNRFFGIILRSLGFQVYSGGARVSKPDRDLHGDDYTGWSHMVNIVTIDANKYLVDVGFGSNGPTHPMPLVDGKISDGIQPQSLRLLWTNIPENTDPSQRLWVYQYRKNDDSPWIFAYCFTELEFLPQDYEIMNYATSTLRTSFFTYMVVCTKTILEGEEVIGILILVGNVIKRRVKGKTEVLMTCETERQRVEGLRKWFGISLTDAEQQGIMGTVTQLSKGDSKEEEGVSHLEV